MSQENKHKMMKATYRLEDSLYCLDAALDWAKEAGDQKTVAKIANHFQSLEDLVTEIRSKLKSNREG